MSKESTRRELLHWIGSGCVLALGSELLAACELPPSARRRDERDMASARDARPDGSSADTRPLPDTGALSDTKGDGGNTFPFEPGSGELEIFENWPIRTIDIHDLADLLRFWKLDVGGMVSSPKTFTFADLLRLQRTDTLVDFHCVEGWSVYDVPWNGVHLSQIFGEVGVSSAATHVSFYTFGEKYNESLPIDIALEPRTLLAYGIGGYTLPFTRGFPLRVVVPRLFGYKSAKYVTRIELTDGPIEGFWVKAGYGYDAEVPEGRLREGKY